MKRFFEKLALVGQSIFCTQTVSMFGLYHLCATFHHYLPLECTWEIGWLMFKGVNKVLECILECVVKALKEISIEVGQ